MIPKLKTGGITFRRKGKGPGKSRGLCFAMVAVETRRGVDARIL